MLWFITGTHQKNVHFTDSYFLKNIFPKYKAICTWCKEIISQILGVPLFCESPCAWDALRDFVPFVQFKKRENTHRGVLLLVKGQALACNFTKSNNPPWMLFKFFKLYKWYQIRQSITCYVLIPTNTIYLSPPKQKQYTVAFYLKCN